MCPKPGCVSTAALLSRPDLTVAAPELGNKCSGDHPIRGRLGLRRGTEPPKARWAWPPRCGRGHHKGQPRKQQSEETMELGVDHGAPRREIDVLSTKFWLGLYTRKSSGSSEPKSNLNPKIRESRALRQSPDLSQVTDPRPLE